MTLYAHTKSGLDYTLFGECTNATNSQDGQKMIIYRRNGEILVREKTEFNAKFKVKPNECCVCGTTERLHRDGQYGYRCSSDDCVMF